MDGKDLLLLAKDSKQYLRIGFTFLESLHCATFE
jgi:hypothetical protein